MTSKSRVVGIVLSLFALAGLAAAQETRASLSGTVTDTTGSIVPGASIKLANMETGVVLTATTNEAGLYRFLFLNPGKYKVVATIAGFKTYERENIELTVNQA